MNVWHFVLGLVLGLIFLFILAAVCYYSDLENLLDENDMKRPEPSILTEVDT